MNAYATRTPFSRHLRLRRGVAAAAIALGLAGCGGGDDSPAVTTVQLSGTAATGAAIAGAQVKAVNAQGVVSTGITAADGSFTLQVAEAAPYVLSVVDAAGKTWYSYAAQAGLANITPLTTLAMLDANANKPLADLVATWAAKPLTQEQVLAAAAKVNANFEELMRGQGLDVAKLNVFTAQFQANSTGLDKVLDLAKVDLACSASACTQTITGPGGSSVVSWNGNIATTGITLSWTGSGAGGSDAGGSGSVTVGLGSCKAPVAGTYSMVVQTSVAGASVPEICIDGLPDKPASQAEFCGAGNVTQQLPQGVTIQSCSYDGSKGTIAASLMGIGYTVTYTFVKR